MTRRPWGWVGLLLIASALEGCSGGDHPEEHHADGGCVLFAELEPKATVLMAQFLGDMFIHACVVVAGSLFDPADIDSYRVLFQESLTLIGAGTYTLTLDTR